MSIFDRIKKSATQAPKAADTVPKKQSETFTFAALPESLSEMQALPEAELVSPYQTAALAFAWLALNCETHVCVSRTCSLSSFG